LKDVAKEKLSLECIMFLTHCLQENEEDRKCIKELINHPYITTPINTQTDISGEQLNKIFNNSSKYSSKKS